MPPVAHSRRKRLSWLVGLVCAIGLLFVGLVGLRAIFPLEFREEILVWSAAYDLDPAWVASVIRNESRFRPDAVSPAGAIGLMQIMPETGEWIGHQLQWPDYSISMLAGVSENISLGTWYLRYLLDRFGTVDAALLAYNAGPTNAERWEGRVDLAFPETRQYIRRVQESLPVYRAYFAAPWLINLIPSLHF